MKKIILLLFSLSMSFAYSQNNLTLTGKTKDRLQKILDSAMQSKYFITISDAEKILGKPSHIKDSTYKFVNGILRYSFDYVSNNSDSIFKGKIFFAFEQYDNNEIAKTTYQSLKTENEKTSAISIYNDIGNEAFLSRDNLNQPFLMIRKDNDLFKFKVYYVTDKISFEELIRVSKKTIAAY